MFPATNASKLLTIVVSGLDEAARAENLTQKERMEKWSGDEEGALERPDHFSHSQVKSLHGLTPLDSCPGKRELAC